MGQVKLIGPNNLSDWPEVLLNIATEFFSRLVQLINVYHSPINWNEGVDVGWCPCSLFASHKLLIVVVVW